jgi:hypothetical protein
VPCTCRGERGTSAAAPTIAAPVAHSAPACQHRLPAPSRKFLGCRETWRFAWLRGTLPGEPVDVRARQRRPARADRSISRCAVGKLLGKRILSPADPLHAFSTTRATFLEFQSSQGGALSSPSRSSRPSRRPTFSRRPNFGQGPRKAKTSDPLPDPGHQPRRQPEHARGLSAAGQGPIIDGKARSPHQGRATAIGRPRRACRRCGAGDPGPGVQAHRGPALRRPASFKAAKLRGVVHPKPKSRRIACQYGSHSGGSQTGDRNAMRGGERVRAGGREPWAAARLRSGAGRRHGVNAGSAGHLSTSRLCAGHLRAVELPARRLEPTSRQRAGSPSDPRDARGIAGASCRARTLLAEQPAPRRALCTSDFGPKR